MFFRFVLILIALAGLYSLYGIIHFKWMYHSVENPKADFLTLENNENGQDQDEKSKNQIMMVEYLNYGCEYCKEMHPRIKELLSLRKDITYIARPIVFGDEAMMRLNNIVLAAGLQGQFWEMHNAILEYPEMEVPDSFIEETANLYGMDYNKLIEDSQSKAIEKIAENNMASMTHAGIDSVPSFVINGDIHLVANENLPQLKDLLEIITATQKK